MYCTGGIRCERATALLSQMERAEDDLETKGIFHVRGGIDRYLKTFPEGGYWKGRNYLFDLRGEQKPEEKDERTVDRETGSVCCVCKSPHGVYKEALRRRKVQGPDRVRRVQAARRRGSKLLMPALRGPGPSSGTSAPGPRRAGALALAGNDADSAGGAAIRSAFSPRKKIKRRSTRRGGCTSRGCRSSSPRTTSAARGEEAGGRARAGRKRGGARRVGGSRTATRGSSAGRRTSSSTPESDEAVREARENPPRAGATRRGELRAGRASDETRRGGRRSDRPCPSRQAREREGIERESSARRAATKGRVECSSCTSIIYFRKYYHNTL